MVRKDSSQQGQREHKTRAELMKVSRMMVTEIDS